MDSRRVFLKRFGATGAVVLLPIGCGSSTEEEPLDDLATTGDETTVEVEADAIAVPTSKPAGWDPIAFNLERGNAGAIPESYHESINGPDGELKHVGKHLPYWPELDTEIPEGMVAIMWGDPSKGHARHPNAPTSEDNPEGHWYDWIRVRKATDADAEEAESRFPAWPGEGYLVQGGGELTGDDGKNTIYLVRLPSDVQPGDEIRIYANCLTHGEYVDFLTMPA